MSLLWKELHTRALQNKGEDDTPYLTEFSKKIPKYTRGCSCQEFWRIYIRTHPPKFGPNEEYFAWTVECHNAVNKKLNKPTYTIEETKKFYL